MSDNESKLKNLVLAPWILKATALIGIERRVGGNAFRHAMATLAICLDYKFFSNSILLKASVIHDLIEDIPSTNISELRSIDSEANQVVDLVLEVTRKEEQTKLQYLTQLKENGSFNAKILKVADRISNLTDLNRDIYTDSKMVDYLNQTENYVLPMAKEVSKNMYKELNDLIDKRRTLFN
jgi:(p)ppGpp synthase/HD superfamily hydrolase